MDYDKDVVQVRYDDDIAVVTMNYPKRRNAYSMDMRVGLLDVFSKLVYDDKAKAIVLTGAGGNFSAGGDISQMKPRGIVERRLNLDLSHRLIKLIIAGPKGVVAAVDGYAYGAGLSIAAACDYVVAAADAKLCLAFLRIGLVPDLAGRFSLSNRVGPARAKELTLRANEVGAIEAERIGLVNRVVEPGKTQEAAMEIAREFAAKPPIAFALAKASFAEGVGSLEDSLRNEMDYQAMLGTTADHHEATRAFLEKRKPVFSGT